MCFRCYQNDTAPSSETRAIYAAVDATQPADATGAAIVDAVALARPEAVRDLIRTGKRSGVAINSPNCSPADARRVLRACAAGELRA